MRKSHTLLSAAIAAAVAAGLSLPAQAHHGFGLFQLDINKEWSGTLTKMELVNPHSYMHLTVTGDDGKPLELNCEMRAASLIKRSGWDADMFKVGAHVDIKGHPHRDDPHACYIESFSINGAKEVNRNDQVTVTKVDTSKRPARLPDGQLNISGDWAVEQLVLTVPPSGGNGSMIPKSLIADYASGKITDAQVRALQPPPAKVVYTDKGQAAAKQYNGKTDNPWWHCKPTSFIRDWTADWPINQFTQRTLPSGEKVIDITYGLYNLKRQIHIGMAKHPDKLTPSNAGHSIGNWEGDTLVVDTVGFEPGYLSPPTHSSDQMHIVERFTLDTQKMALKREYSVTDPVNLAAPYASYDVMYLSDTPFEAHPCKDMTPEFQASQQAALPQKK
ncbi:MAG TPA: DUF6152 family protein [Candidatus Acidoferrum sp.]|nr:DUF6152 family protein [Candidatus Acidoferrum sp.]